MAVLAALMIIAVGWIGISSILSDSQDKDKAIAELKQQLTDARRGIDLCEGTLRGYQLGRR
ncbi:MAG TPA: hypothetical protein V6D12_13615 [Candidatus Obscuribacterales bacterium]